VSGFWQEDVATIIMEQNKVLVYKTFELIVIIILRAHYRNKKDKSYKASQKSGSFGFQDLPKFYYKSFKMHLP
jgi:hypothetical protein